jgi:RNA polymerase sigma-70 factor (ECF subfamily)
MSVAMSINPPAQPAPRIIRLAQAGDDPARDELARFCLHTAFVSALQGCGNRHDAQDVAQDAVVRVLTALDRFRADHPVRPWLLQIVRNLLIDNRRRASTRKTEPLCTDNDILVEPTDPDPGPEAAAAQHELQFAVWVALAGLEPRDREILTLRDYLDLSYEEIAETLSIKRGTVMSRLHRARSRLRKVVLSQQEAHHA